MTREQMEKMASEYAESENLPTKSQWIETRGGEHGQYLSYEVRWFVEDAYLAGLEAGQREVQNVRSDQEQREHLLRRDIQKLAEQNAELRRVLGMVDAVGMCDPYDQIVREALKESEVSGE